MRETGIFFDALCGTVPLLGLSLQLRSDQNGIKFLLAVDLRGNKYYIQGREGELVVWYEDIAKKCKTVLLDIINSGSSVRVNCSSQENSETGSYIIVTLNKENAKFKFLLTKVETEIPLGNIVNVIADENKFEIKYTQDGSEQTLSFKADNAFGLADIFKYLSEGEYIQSMVDIRNRGESVWIQSDRNINEPTGKVSMSEPLNNRTQSQPPLKSSKKKKEITLDDFELLKVVGRGAFGKVLLCRFSEDGRIFAMKCIMKKSLVKHKKKK